MSRRRAGGMLWAAVLGLALGAGPARAGSVAVVNGTIETITNGTIEGGTVLIQDGKITAVGAEVAVPPGVPTLDATDLVVLPGLVVPRSSLGLRGRRGDDRNSVTGPLQPQLQAFWAVDPLHPDFPPVREGGATLVHVTPGNRNLIGGQGVLLKTKFSTTVDPLVVRHPSAMVLSLGETPKATYGGKKQAPATRMGSAALIRQKLQAATEHARKWAEYREKLAAREAGEADGGTDGEEGEEDAPQKPKRPARDAGLDALADLLAGTLPAIVHAHRADDILTALRLGEEFGFPVIIDGGGEAHLVAAELAAAGAAVLYGPIRMGGRPLEALHFTPRTPGLLERAGVPVAFLPNEGGLYGPVATRELPLDAAFAVREGMSRAAALRAITLTPAEILGVADRVGSLEPGKDGDLMLYSGDPFKIRSRPVGTIIDGEITSRTDS